MLAMMEKYACNLEALVAARTEQLLQEKRRTDDLLHRMLPRYHEKLVPDTWQNLVVVDLVQSLN